MNVFVIGPSWTKGHGIAKKAHNWRQALSMAAREPNWEKLQQFENLPAERRDVSWWRVEKDGEIVDIYIRKQ